MKKFLMSSAAVAFLFSSLPVLGMDAQKEDEKPNTVQSLPLYLNASSSEEASHFLSSELGIRILDYATNRRIVNNPDVIYERPFKIIEEKSMLYALRRTCKAWKAIVAPIIQKFPISSCLLGKPFSVLYPSLISVMNIDLSNRERCQQVYQQDDNPFKNIYACNFHTRNDAMRSKPFDETCVGSLKSILTRHANNIKYLRFDAIPKINEMGADVLLECLPKLTNLEELRISFCSISQQKREQLINTLPQSIKKIALQHIPREALPLITQIVKTRPHLNAVILLTPEAVINEYSRSMQTDDDFLKCRGFKEINCDCTEATRDSIEEFEGAVKARPNYQEFTYSLQ